MRNRIEIEHVSKSFGGQKVLNDVSLVCESGKIYGIIGYNGSGKTVLFKCICGFYHADQGKIMVNEKMMGRDIRILTDAGIIIEQPGFLRSRSGFRNLDYLYSIRHKRNPGHIRETMERVGPDPGSRKPVGKYSLGMRQRLAIAQATMEDQGILILDEPMNGLDREGVQEMRTFFAGLRGRGKLILMASHNKEDIDVLCDEVYEMEHGALKRIK